MRSNIWSALFRRGLFPLAMCACIVFIFGVQVCDVTGYPDYDYAGGRPLYKRNNPGVERQRALEPEQGRALNPNTGKPVTPHPFSTPKTPGYVPRTAVAPPYPPGKSPRISGNESPDRFAQG